MKTATLAIFLLISSFVSAIDMPKVGAQAPDFTLTSGDGKPVSLKDFRGKWVVLYFYPKNFTSGCTIEARNFQKDQGEFQKLNSVVLGVSADNAYSHKSFCDKEGLTFKTLADKDTKVSAAYGSVMNLAVAKYAKRNTFIIDPSGKIASVFVDVNPNKHSSEVLSALNTLESANQGKSR
ncbi:MAG: Alkyl hydroperoxide reductase subunit C-like protein [Acidobacteriales bacterium]|nr:Alkyl hydroperoxide reductase subunit C-like protein [Terriglobales bacterium]